MTKITRNANPEKKDEALRYGNTFSLSEIEDVLELIATKQWPNGKFSDNECCLWSKIREKLNIYY